MGKILQPYGGIDANVIIAKASDTAEMVVSGINVDCTNISLSRIAKVLAENRNSVGGLCTSPKVNKYSNFSPLKVTINPNDNVPKYTIKTPYQLGYFAGYNHNAKPPKLTIADKTTLPSEPQSTIAMSGTFNLGEIDWNSAMPTQGYDLEIIVDGVSIYKQPFANVPLNTDIPFNFTIVSGIQGSSITHTADIWFSKNDALKGRIEEAHDTFVVTVPTAITLFYQYYVLDGGGTVEIYCDGILTRTMTAWNGSFWINQLTPGIKIKFIVYPGRSKYAHISSVLGTFDSNTTLEWEFTITNDIEIIAKADDNPTNPSYP